MREPKRLDDLYNFFNQIHKAKFCDIRFGQLMYVFNWWLTEVKQVDIFYIEDDKMIKYFEEFSNKQKK